MKNLKAYIELAYEADIRLAVHGRHGVGKTAVVEDLNEEGYYVLTMILSQSDPLVLGGYPGRELIVTTPDGDTEVVGIVDGAGQVHMTTFAKPQWIMKVEAAAAKGLKVIVFLDEFNRADKYAHDAAMRLVNEKEINGHRLPADTLFVCACNPETEGDEGVNPMSDPMIDRWCHVPVHSDNETWLEWAEGKGKVNKWVTGFIRTNPDALTDFHMENFFEEQILSRIGATERSNDAVGRVLDVLEARAAGDYAEFKKLVNVFYNMVRGLIGSEHTGQLVSYIEDNFFQPFTVDEMLNPTDEVMAKAQELRDRNMTEVLNVSLEEARKEIPARGIEATIENLEGFFEFMSLAPVDIQTAFWYGNKEQAAYWTGILATMPDNPSLKKVMAALNDE